MQQPVLGLLNGFPRGNVMSSTSGSCRHNSSSRDQNSLTIIFTAPHFYLTILGQHRKFMSPLGERSRNRWHTKLIVQPVACLFILYHNLYFIFHNEMEFICVFDLRQLPSNFKSYGHYMFVHN